MNFEPGVEQALMEVHALGKKDDSEHAIVVRNGQVVFKADGDAEHVNLNDRLELLREGDVLVHNHPNSLNSLSNVDIVQVFARKLGAIYAIADDKSIYKASAGAQPSATRFLRSWEVAAVSLSLNHSTFPQRLNEAHWLNQKLANAGVIEYEYQLGEETKEAVSKLDSKVQFPGFESMMSMSDMLTQMGL